MRRMLFRFAALGASAVLAATSAIDPAHAAQTGEAKSLEELRNTVVNLLQALVEKGVMTREQAEGLVKQAQDKAATDAAAAAALEGAEADAVRVTHVPDIVKLEIKNQVAQEVKPQVVTEVLAAARNEKWGVPGALPEWVSKVRFVGDVRVRAQGDLFADDNAQNTYLDFNAVNDRGGIGRAGAAAFSNTTEDRERLRVRARFGVEANPSDSVLVGVRLSTGNLRDPVSTNQTLANTFGRYAVGLERAFVRWDFRDSGNLPWLTLGAGRMPNPWQSTDLLFDEDLSFDGAFLTTRFALSSANPRQRFLFVTLGGFPIEEVELSKEEKWLIGAQLGTDYTFSGGTRLRFAGAIYDYENTVGERNTPDSTLFDFTAPDFLQRGNTLFDIRNDADTSTNLFALAADYTVVDVNGSLEVPLSAAYRLAITASYLRNIAYDEKGVLARTGLLVEERTEGYQTELGLTRANFVERGGWRAFIGYRYLQRDATLDAFTDSDFRLGGTDMQGYYFGGLLGLASNTWLRLRYLSGNEIDGPPLGIDVWQLDVNAQF